LTLLHWRRRVHELYADVRRLAPDDGPGALAAFRAGRDELFANHPDSPLADRRAVPCPWWPYDPAWRIVAEVQPRPAERLVVHSGTGEPFSLVRIGAVEVPGGSLDVHWLDVYGGGVFVPFADATNGRSTYGGGRYLLDTIKGADLGGDGDRLWLDFNFAYHPSCAYHPRWSCPLAPPGNRLPVAVEAGERLTGADEEHVPPAPG
jgi:uncharacterized protein (DUF1684 family)